MDESGAIAPESELERRIVADPEWREGVRWGRPRPGHPEGSVLAHVREVLENVDRWARSPAERARLRLIALVHDAFKYRVDRSLPRTGANHHGALARTFAERHIDDPGVLEVIEHHDAAYGAWSFGRRSGRWDEAEERARALIARLGEHLDLYLAFYRCDKHTGDKTDADLEWFEALCEQSGAGSAKRP